MSTTTKPQVIRFTTRGRVVIPIGLRKQFRMDGGTKASVTATPEGILIKPATRRQKRSRFTHRL